MGCRRYRDVIVVEAVDGDEVVLKEESRNVEEPEVLRAGSSGNGT